MTGENRDKQGLPEDSEWAANIVRSVIQKRNINISETDFTKITAALDSAMKRLKARE